MTAPKHSTGVPCEACGRPIRRGQFVNVYDDVGEVHVNCDAPFAPDKGENINIRGQWFRIVGRSFVIDYADTHKVMVCTLTVEEEANP